MTGDWLEDLLEMSEGRVDEMDGETCSESCQDSDVDGSEFPGCKGSVDDQVVGFLWYLGGMVSRHKGAKISASFHWVLDVFCRFVNCSGCVPRVTWPLMWYVHVGRGAPWKHAKPWP